MRVLRKVLHGLVMDEGVEVRSRKGLVGIEAVIAEEDLVAVLSEVKGCPGVYA